MSTTTVRIDEGSRQTLRSLSQQTKRSMSVVVAEAIECYRRRLFLEQLNAGYAALQLDEAAWAEETREREEWDVTLADGLEED